MAFDLKHVRGTSVALIILGVLIFWWGVMYGYGLGWFGYVPILSAHYQIGETVGGIGVFIATWGFLTLVRHKGDYDDFDDNEEKSEDDSRNEHGATR